MEGVTWLYQWGGQLASVAEQVVQKVPEKEEWNTLRHFLNNVSRLLRRGDFRAGARAFYKVIPMVQRALSSTEKVTNIHSTYDVTASISEHFLVDDAVREEVNSFMETVKHSIDQLKVKVESFAARLDFLLEEVAVNGGDVGVMEAIRLAFQMNRINAHIHSCEDQLLQVRRMLDEVDTHVAGKTLLATLLSYIAFICGIVFSSSGQLPLGAACITAATATRKSAKSLQTYRQEIAKLEADHRRFQCELTKWKHNFRSEQINFLLLIGLKKLVISFVLTVLILLLVGKAANFFVFALLFMYFVMKCEEHASKRYYGAVAMALVAIVIKVQKHQGLVAFNSLSLVAALLCYMGFIDL